MLLIESPTLYTAEALTSINEVLDALSESPISPPGSASLILLPLRSGEPLMSVPFASSSWTDEEAALLKERVQSDPMVKNYLVSEDLHGLFINLNRLTSPRRWKRSCREILNRSSNRE